MRKTRVLQEDKRDVAAKLVEEAKELFRGSSAIRPFEMMLKLAKADADSPEEALDTECIFTGLIGSAFLDEMHDSLEEALKDPGSMKPVVLLTIMNNTMRMRKILHELQECLDQKIVADAEQTMNEITGGGQRERKVTFDPDNMEEA